ncbi:MAG: hypothetical protein IPL53_14725 [Ignavibacteria bacterium]|nr:hypothetical protein [Ignavibacteria bacterium]
MDAINGHFMDSSMRGFTGGIFLTTNGGANWTRKYYAGRFSKSWIKFILQTIGLICIKKHSFKEQVMEGTHGII